MRRGLSLRWRMVILLAGIPLLVLTPLIFVVRQQQRNSFRDAFFGKANIAIVQMEQTVSTIAPFVTTLENAPGLDRLLEITTAYAADFDFIGLVDGSGHVIVSPMSIYAGRTLEPLRQLEDGATMQGDTDEEPYAVVRRDLGYGNLYLVWRAMAMPGDPDALLYVVVGESVSTVAPSLLPLIIIGLVTAVGMVFLIRLSLDRLVIAPLNRLAAGAEAIAAGDRRHRISLDRDDEFGFLAGAFNEMAERIDTLVSGLEQRVDERTTALQRRNAQLEAVSVVSQEAARYRNVNTLLNAAVNAITDNFGFYHTGIFILDDRREWAILRAASSEGGRRMLNRGHRLEVGRVGIVGYVAAQGRPRVAFNVGSDTVWFQNPDLPQTQAEMALPLMTDEQVIGVLDIQSDRASTEARASFTDEDIRILQLMADQLTVALTNARALETMEAALQELQAIQVDYSRRGWARVMQRMRPLAYEYDRVTTTPVPPLPVPEDLAEGRVSHKIVMDGGMPVVVEALRIGGRTLGYLGLSDPDRTWSEEELTLINSVGEQVALALDNARLFEDTQSNERQQYLISSVLQVASNPDYGADEVLNEVARILAQGLDMAVAIFTFPYTARTVVRSHAVVDPDGESVPLFEGDIELSREHFIFFQGLETSDLGPMAPLLASSGYDAFVQTSRAGTIGPGDTAGRSEMERLSELYDFERVLYVPIRSAGTPSGFIGFIQRQDTPPLDPETREVAQNLATQVAVVLENLSLTEETRRRSEELRQLYRISLELSAQLSPDDVLNLIVQEGAGLLNADAANLWVYEVAADETQASSSGHAADAGADSDESGLVDTLRLAYDYHGGAEGRLGFASQSGQGLAGMALRQQQTVLVDDYATWEGRISELVSSRYHGMMAVPLVGRFGPLGVFVALSEQIGAFGEREAGLADLFSAQAATALENTRLNEDAQQRAEEFSQLYEAGLDLITIREAEDLVSQAADWARRIFEAERSVVFLRPTRSSSFVKGLSVSDLRYLVESEQDHRSSDASPGIYTSRMVQPSEDGLTQSIIRQRQTVLILDNRTSPHDSARRLVDYGLLSQIGAPLTVGDQVLGALFVNAAMPGRFDEEDLALLEFLATQVSSALQNAIQFGQTEEALAVVGQQARYQSNVSQAVALLNDRGTEAAPEVLHLLGEAADVPATLYFEPSNRNGRADWRLTESWMAEEGALTGGDIGSWTLSTDRLTIWKRALLEAGQVMVKWDELPSTERQYFVPFEFGAALGLSVPGEGELPGFLAFFRKGDELWGEQEVVALQTVAAALSNTIARENLFQQVQATLSETEALYRGGAALSEANTYESILEVLLAHTALGRDAETASMQLFDHPWIGDRRPEFLEMVSAWRHDGAVAGRGATPAAGSVSQMRPEVGEQRRYRLDEVPMLSRVLQDGQPVFVEDLTQDMALRSPMASDLKRWAAGAKSMVLMPLMVGGQRIGFLQAGYAEPQVFSETDRRRLVSLAQQASIAVLNIRQLRATEARVRREQLIRQITGRIQEAPDVDGVLQTAVREIAQAFGTPRGLIQFRPPQETASDHARTQAGGGDSALDISRGAPAGRSEKGERSQGPDEGEARTNWRHLDFDEG